MPEAPTPGMLQRMGYTIQTGAFLQVENAARMTRSLSARGIDAYYFRHESGFYKVRFGNYTSLDEASRIAADCRAKGLIQDYYIVRPDMYPAIIDQRVDQRRLRSGLVSSARSFIGVPYQWGGESDATGFDCSGLTMAVYQLNGFSLPRTSESQWRTGVPVPVHQLTEGDLVFFATNGNGAVSHVGIYIGKGEFIHAPGTGKGIRIDSLSSDYFQRRYKGGRTYAG